MKKLPHLVHGLLLAIAAATPAMAQEATVESVSAKVDFFVGNLWLLIAAALVFLMHLGFATLEAGLTQQKEYGEHFVQKRIHHLHGYLSLCSLGIQCDVSRRF
jgi:hypothetical protein